MQDLHARGLVHRLVAKHLETFLRFAQERSGGRSLGYRDASGLPRDEAVRVEAGAVTFVQRFNGGLGLDVHSHVIATDGASRYPDGGVTSSLVPTRSPTRDDLEGVLVRVTDRVARALEQGRATEAGDDALTGCRRATLSRGTYGAPRSAGPRTPRRL